MKYLNRSLGRQVPHQKYISQYLSLILSDDKILQFYVVHQEFAQVDEYGLVPHHFLLLGSILLVLIK